MMISSKFRERFDKYEVSREINKMVKEAFKAKSQKVLKMLCYMSRLKEEPKKEVRKNEDNVNLCG